MFKRQDDTSIASHQPSLRTSFTSFYHVLMGGTEECRKSTSFFPITPICIVHITDILCVFPWGSAIYEHITNRFVINLREPHASNRAQPGLVTVAEARMCIPSQRQWAAMPRRTVAQCQRVDRQSSRPACRWPTR